MVRIAAAISAVVIGVLLAWVVYATFFYPQPVVTPTGGLIRSEINDPLPGGPQARAALAQRTELQGWRAESGPSPDGKHGADLAVGGAEMPRGQAMEDAEGAELTQRWLANRAVDWPVVTDRGYTAGTASLPLERDSVLMQPQGRDFRRLHESGIPYTGGWIILGVSFLLSVFLLLRGRVPLAEGFSGETVERFDAFERANHWMTASSFIVLGLTGLILIYGWTFLQPLFGSSAYGTIAEASLFLHIAFAPPFFLGILVMAVIWTRQNLISRLDFHWLRRGGGFLSDSPDNPPARRFNAGQKLVFWGVVLGGLIMAVSGITLMFPFYWTDVVSLQWVLLGHGLFALLMVGLILGHIYIGTIGMEGAFDAMWSGQVDRNWAKEHHELWLEELEHEGREPPSRGERAPAPAE